MRHAPIVIFMCLALPSGAVAQQPGANDAPLPAAADSESSPPPAAQNPAEPQAPPEKQTLAVRVRRLLDDFNQRHEQRMQEISSYDKAGDSEPGLKQLADPRKVELELKDERDRERTSEALANLYAEEAGQVKSQEQAVEEFLAKRHKSLDDLSKRTSKINRQDLELAAENLARQPGTEAQVREIRGRLAEADRNDKELSAQRPQIQLEIAGAEEELKKVRALEQSLGEQSKAYAADAASARQNQLSLADRLEFYLVRAKAEDVLDEDREATQTVQHLSASPEVRDTLSSPAPKAKPGAKPDTPKECDDKSSDGKGCAETTAQAPKE